MSGVRKVMYREMVDWSTSNISAQISSVISGVPAGDNQRLAERKFPRAATF